MNKLMKGFGLLLLAASALAASAANAETWITHPQAVEADAQKKPVALQFRREIRLAARPRQLFVHVSADNRFILYVNGQRVGQGPSRGDLAHWRYERLDLAPYLKAGANVIAAQVWNDGPTAPLAQVSAGRTAFVMEPEGPGRSDLDTAAGWQVRVDASRTPIAGRTQIAATVGRGFYAAGAPETFDGAQRDWSWMSPVSSARDWRPAVHAASGPTPWKLTADPLPQMRYDAKPMGALVRSSGVRAAGFPARPVTIPANTTATLLLDAGAVEAAYPQLTLSGGNGAEVTLHYAEALYDAKKERFSDRARVDDGQVLGIYDTFRPDGSASRTYQPYWWRVWRFAEVRVKTGDQPLTLEGVRRFQTGYPFAPVAKFVSNDNELNRIWQIGWDTVRVDAHESYQDSSYWEQLQYIGDTRLQMLVTYALTRDPRLPIRALDAVSESRLNGLPRSAYPSRSDQSIPPFTLIAIGMLHDYWMRQPDLAPVQRNLETVRGTLDWYSKTLHDGLVGPSPGWQFIDWRPGLSEMPRPNAPPAPDSCVITLLYVGALKQAAELEEAVGDRQRASADRASAESATQAIRSRCWDAGRGLFANTPDKQAFSQQANVLAVLYDVAPQADQVAILDRVTVRGQGIDAPEGITGSTYYFSFYLARALEHAGLGDRYLELMPTWRRMLAKNFTTWPEEGDPTRSDTHAWSAHPTADLLAIVAGVEPASPGFTTVRIAPHLGDITSLDATTAHPRGLIQTTYRRQGQRLDATVTLPAGISGEFVWNGKSEPLKPGVNRLTVEAR